MMISYKEKEGLFKRSLKGIWETNPGQVILSTVKGDPCLRWVDKDVEVVINDKPGIFSQIKAMFPLIREKYACLISSNDLLLPHKLTEEEGILEKTGKKVCYSSFVIKNEISKKEESVYLSKPYSYADHLKGNFVNDSAMVCSRLLKKYGLKEKYKNNTYYDLWLRIYEGEGNVFINNDNPTWVYYVTRDSQHIKRKKDKKKYKQNKLDRQAMINNHIATAHKLELL